MEAHCGMGYSRSTKDGWCFIQMDHKKLLRKQPWRGSWRMKRSLLGRQGKEGHARQWNSMWKGTEARRRMQVRGATHRLLRGEKASGGTWTEHKGPGVRIRSLDLAEWAVGSQWGDLSKGLGVGAGGSQAGYKTSRRLGSVRPGECWGRSKGPRPLRGSQNRC